MVMVGKLILVGSLELFCVSKVEACYEVVLILPVMKDMITLRTFAVGYIVFV